MSGPAEPAPPPAAAERDLPESVRRAWEALNRDLLGEPQFTPLELSERSGASPELLRRLWQSLGFPPVSGDARMFTATDVETVRALVGLPSGEPANEELLLQLTRMAGRTQARLAEALAELIHDRNGSADSATDLIARNTPFVKSLEPLLSYVWRRHLLAALGRHLVSHDGAAGRVLVVGFADLVAFTALARRLQEAHLAAVVERFEALVYQHVPANRGRVVKLLGDEVLFVADTTAAAAAIATGLVESIGADPELPEIRVGLAHGPVVALGGDVFGPTVNLASRLVDEARPGTIVVTEEIGSTLDGDPLFEARRLRGRLNLKGIGRVHAYALRRRPAAASESDKEKRQREARELAEQKKLEKKRRRAEEKERKRKAKQQGPDPAPE